MARTLYGGSGADLVAQVAGDGDFQPSTANFLVYTDRAATTQVTDLRDIAGTTISSVVPDAAGRILFYGVDGYKGPYYLRQASSSAEPWRVDPADHVTRLIAVETAGSTVYYTLPAGGIPQTDLAAAVGTKLDGAVQRTTVDAKGDLLAGTADNTVARQGVGADGQHLVADSTQPTGLNWQAPTDLSGYATKSGSIAQFADVSDLAFFDRAVPVYDGSTGALEPTDMSTRFAAADASTGRLATAAYGKYQRDIVVVNQGEQPPADITAGTIGFTRPAVASMVPIMLRSGYVQAANNVGLVLPESLAVNDRVGIAIVADAAGTLASFVVTVSAGAANMFYTTFNMPNSTAAVQFARLEVTTAIPGGSTITVTPKDGTGTTINRTHLLAACYRLNNLAASTPLDQQVNNSGSSSSTLTSVVAGPTAADTVQANELAIGLVGWSSGSASAVPAVSRTLAGTNGWTELTQLKSDNGSSGRSLFVAYQILTTVQRPRMTTQMTASDNQTGIWSSTLATYKGA